MTEWQRLPWFLIKIMPPNSIKEYKQIKVGVPYFEFIEMM